MDNKISLWSETKKLSFFEKDVKKVAKATLLFLKKQKSAVSIFIVSNNSIKKINYKFRNKNSPTTVLSFKYPKNLSFLKENKKLAVFLGEIYISPNSIKAKNGCLPCLVVHSILHLCGYTHNKNRDTIKMEAREKLALRFLEKKENVKHNHRN